jgi:secondary thiamine-phosphate synthase enzyme
VSSISPRETDPASSANSGWAQRVITLDPKSRGIFIWTETLRTNFPEMRDVRVGMVNLFLRSTTCALTINENCDPDVRTDMQNALEALVPGSDVDRASIVGNALDLPVRDGRLALGTWQGLYLVASEAGPVEVVATVLNCSLTPETTTNVKVPAPSRGCHSARETVEKALGTVVENAASSTNQTSAACLLNVTTKHTSASLMINARDAGFRVDMETALNALVPESWNYPGGAVQFRHVQEGDDDMPAHVKSTLLGATVTVPVGEGNEILFGESQDIYLCEHRDGGGFGGTDGTRDAIVTKTPRDQGKRTSRRTVLEIRTSSRGCADIGELLRRTLASSPKKIETGWVNVFSRDPSASFALGDAKLSGGSLTRALDEVARIAGPRFSENVKTALTKTSVTGPLGNGKMCLGDDQTVFLCEHGETGGGIREVVVTVQGVV